MSEALPLSITDAESTYKAIIDLLLKYTEYPSSFSPTRANILWNNTLTSVSIGLYPLQGAVYIKKYISGNYKAQFPFQLTFKSNPTNSDAMIKAQSLVDDLGKWLEKCAIDFKDDTLTFESMKRMSPTYILNQNDKQTEFAIEMQLTYSKKGR